MTTPCRRCGSILDPIHLPTGTHPGCDPEPPVDEAMHDAIVAAVHAQLGQPTHERNTT